MHKSGIALEFGVKHRQIVKLDVMLRGRYIHTFRLEVSPGDVWEEDRLVDYIIERLPTLRNKPFNIHFAGFEPL